MVEASGGYYLVRVSALVFTIFGIVTVRAFGL